ncbi:formate dehydrogenase accessory sulfurtransferase FdhD [soil metagenome]
MTQRPGSDTKTRIWAVDGTEVARRADRLATEEPLEIRLVAGRERRTLAVTMRTPGSDFELAAGFLHGEGVVSQPSDVRTISYCVDHAIHEEQRFNIINVELESSMLPDVSALERHFFTSSACGVCGKTSLESLRMARRPSISPGPVIERDVVYGLPDKLRAAQGLFTSTGGLHAAALFEPDGNIVAVREDVGRHNALDKLIGWALLQARLPLAGHIVLVSGRASFELLQKCIMAGAPFVCAVSAPSSLAVELAREFGITLVGFLRAERFNIYACPERLAL